MLPFLRRQRARSGNWVSVAVHGDRIALAQMEPGTQGRSLLRCHSHRFGDEAAEALGRMRRQLGRDRFLCCALLDAGSYQMQMTDAPPVPEAELREAVRWKLRDLLDYPVDQATVDVARVPGSGHGGAYAQHLFAVSARNAEIAARMRLFHAARFPLHAFDVPEMAQRNVAALFEQPGRGVAVLSMDVNGGLLTVTRDGELFLARRTDIGLAQIEDAAREVSEQALDRLVLELQRSLDHFYRQFAYVTVASLLVTPIPVLLRHLQANLDLPVEALALDSAMDVSAVPELADPVRQRQYLHLIGAAMRSEPHA